MSFFNNPWVVGIGGGILSGAIVAWLTHIFLARGENKEYMQKVANANRDVIYAIRPGISEGQIPTKEVVAALIHSTARRNSVTPSDLYTQLQLAEELIKEVMDSSFLSSARKAEYCQQLMPLHVPASPTGVRMKVEYVDDASVAISNYRRKATKRVSALLGIITGLIGTMLTLFPSLFRKETPSIPSQFLLLGLIIVTVLGTAFGVYVVSIGRSSRLDRAKVKARDEAKRDEKISPDQKSEPVGPSQQ